MADGSGATAAGYRAFISYSHRDAVFAARLHRRLESYVLPKRLGVERRLTPIFKDREELPAAHDLSAQVRAALAVSDCLIVVCSPDAAASPWVGREIKLFRELHPDRPILAALIQGEPAEAFPGALAWGGVEPLAADFRKEADGERLALLKLIAGIAGIGLDQLLQRDSQRRLRGVMAITGAALVGMLTLGLTTAFALSAQAESERQRAQAEGLIEFMLTDLRDRLEEVGSLKVLTEVNRRALAYYEGRQVESLPPASRLLYARLLHANGEDLASRANLDGARIEFTKAYQITKALLEGKPDDVDRIWTHAQSAYWLGFADYQGKQPGPARRHWSQYLSLARRLAELEPLSARAGRELAFAEGNLCTLSVKWEKNAKEALTSCKASLAAAIAAAELDPATTDSTIGIANRRGWLADALELAGDLGAARQQRVQQAAMVGEILRSDPDNQKARDNWVGSQRALARIAFLEGNRSEAFERIDVVRQHLTEMTLRDPSNDLWREYLANANDAKVYFETHRHTGARQ